MIQVVKNKLLIEYGNWYVMLENRYLGTLAILKYKTLARNISWIKNDRIKLFLTIRLIKGDSYPDAMNLVFTKEYLTHKDYRNIERE